MTSKNTVCIYTQPRTGSNYLQSILASDSSYHNLYEFFNSHYWTILDVMSLMSKIWKIDMDKDECIEYLSGAISYLDSGILNKNMLNMKKFVKVKKYFNNVHNLGIIFKVFHNNIYHNNLDKDHLFDECDYMILNYRNNLLLRWISETIATQSNSWITYDSKQTSSIKIHWNKSEFIDNAEKMSKIYSRMLDNYMLFDKPKVIISYEKLHVNHDKNMYLRDILNRNKIEINIENIENLTLPKKQSSQTADLADHFNNPEDFLNDLDSIKDLCYARVLEEHDPNYPECEEL